MGAQPGLGERVVQQFLRHIGSPRSLQGDRAGAADAGEEVPVVGEAGRAVERALRRRVATVDALRDGLLVQPRRIDPHALIISHGSFRAAQMTVQQGACI
ncbi:MAG: hypothetical protein CMH34_02900 [Microbacterium sp.]|nr:hypothetical protein [Microbacterium sp.]